MKQRDVYFPSEKETQFIPQSYHSMVRGLRKTYRDYSKEFYYAEASPYETYRGSITRQNKAYSKELATEIGHNIIG